MTYTHTYNLDPEWAGCPACHGRGFDIAEDECLDCDGLGGWYREQGPVPYTIVELPDEDTEVGAMLTEWHLCQDCGDGVEWEDQFMDCWACGGLGGWYETPAMRTVELPDGDVP